MDNSNQLMKRTILFVFAFVTSALSASAQSTQEQSSVKFVQASAGVSDQYLTNLLTRISKYWVTSKLTHQLKCELEFQVSAGGQIVMSRTTRTSGDEMFDKEALDSVRLAAPFPPPESEFLVMISIDNLNLSDSILRQNQQRQLNKLRASNQPQKPVEAIAEQSPTHRVNSTLLKASVEKSWTKPIRIEELQSFDEVAMAQYKIWLLSWIKLPLEIRYPDLAKDLARLPR